MEKQNKSKNSLLLQPFNPNKIKLVRIDVRGEFQFQILDKDGRPIKEIEDHNDTTLYFDLRVGSLETPVFAFMTEPPPEIFVGGGGYPQFLYNTDKLFNKSIFTKEFTFDSTNNQYTVDVNYQNLTGGPLNIFGFGSYAQDNPMLLYSYYVFETPVFLDKEWYFLGRYTIKYTITPVDPNQVNTTDYSQISFMDLYTFQFNRIVNDIFVPDIATNKELKKAIMTHKFNKSTVSSQPMWRINLDYVIGTQSSYKLQPSLVDDTKVKALFYPLRGDIYNFNADQLQNNFTIHYRILTSGGLGVAKAYRILGTNDVTDALHLPTDAGVVYFSNKGEYDYTNKGYVGRMYFTTDPLFGKFVNQFFQTWEALGQITHEWNEGYVVGGYSASNFIETANYRDPATNKRIDNYRILFLYPLVKVTENDDGNTTLTVKLSFDVNWVEDWYFHILAIPYTTDGGLDFSNTKSLYYFIDYGYFADEHTLTFSADDLPAGQYLIVMFLKLSWGMHHFTGNATLNGIVGHVYQILTPADEPDAPIDNHPILSAYKDKYTITQGLDLVEDFNNNNPIFQKLRDDFGQVYSPIGIKYDGDLHFYTYDLENDQLVEFMTYNIGDKSLTINGDPIYYNLYDYCKASYKLKNSGENFYISFGISKGKAFGIIPRYRYSATYDYTEENKQIWEEVLYEYLKNPNRYWNDPFMWNIMFDPTAGVVITFPIEARYYITDVSPNYTPKFYSALYGLNLAYINSKLYERDIVTRDLVWRDWSGFLANVRIPITSEKNLPKKLKEDLSYPVEFYMENINHMLFQIVVNTETNDKVWLATLMDRLSYPQNAFGNSPINSQPFRTPALVKDNDTNEILVALEPITLTAGVISNIISGNTITDYMRFGTPNMSLAFEINETETIHNLKLDFSGSEHFEAGEWINLQLQESDYYFARDGYDTGVNTFMKNQIVSYSIGLVSGDYINLMKTLKQLDIGNANVDYFVNHIGVSINPHHQVVWQWVNNPRHHWVNVDEDLKDTIINNSPFFKGRGG